MIIVTQAQLRNKDTEAIILLRNEIKASFNTDSIDYFTISAIAEILYNKFKFKNEADARYVIDNPNFREVLDKIFKV